ncbi:hypothetical protein ACSBR1_015664 [Camellia fascicularis]
MELRSTDGASIFDWIDQIELRLEVFDLRLDGGSTVSTFQPDSLLLSPLSFLLLSVKSRVRERTSESDTDPTPAPMLCHVDTGVPWTEEEHRMFLLGLQKLGKGDWRGISRNYVISRTPTQVASHAQKYFPRQCNASRRKRRSSLFDIVADEVSIFLSSSLSIFSLFSFKQLVYPSI